MGLAFSHTGEIIVPDELQKSVRLDSFKGRLVRISDHGQASDIDLKDFLADGYNDQPELFQPRATSKPSTSTAETPDTGNLTDRMRQIRATRETPVSKAMKAKAIDGTPGSPATSPNRCSFGSGIWSSPNA